jgi:histidine triad (HIT) family protein
VRCLSKPEAVERLAELRKKLLGGDDTGCLMCALARGVGRPAPLVETETSVVVLDRFARRRGHLLVIAKAHVGGTDEVSWELYLEVERLVFEARHALHRAFAPVQIYSAKLGAVAPLPMSFSHFHAHVIPVYETDERARPARVLSWSEGVFVYEEDEATALRRQIVAAWPER